MTLTTWSSAAEQYRQQLDRPPVFAALGYEPTCLPRHNAIEDGATPEQAPPPCGRCPQEVFHAAAEYDVLYGGAMGGGKTLALLMEALKRAMKYPGLRVGLFRRTYPELEESLLLELRLKLPALIRHYRAEWNESKHELRLPLAGRTSLLMFRHCRSLADAQARLGGAYQLLVFDERTTLDPLAVTFLQTRLRSGDRSVPVLGVRSGTNPGGIGHSVVKRRYVEATKYGAQVTHDKQGRSVRFIPSRATDNPYLNPEYRRELDALPDQMRAAYRDGSWDAFVGQVFAEFSLDRHVVPHTVAEVMAAHSTAAGLPRYGGVDWGWTAPWVYLLGQSDFDGRLWITRELSGSAVTDSQQAAQILACEGGDPVSRFADPSMFASRGAGETTAEAYAAAGVALRRADNQRIPGWKRLHTALADMAGPACLHHLAMGLQSCPRLHISDACTDLLRTLPAMPRDKRNPEDVDTNSEDHWGDALRYLLGGAGEPIAPLPDPHRGPAHTETGDLATAGF